MPDHHGGCVPRAVPLDRAGTLAASHYASLVTYTVQYTYHSADLAPMCSGSDGAHASRMLGCREIAKRNSNISTPRCAPRAKVLDLVSCCARADPKLQSAMEDSSFGSECTTFVKGVSGLSPRVKWPALLEKCCHAASLPLSLHGLPRPKLGKESLLPVVANDLQHVP